MLFWWVWVDVYEWKQQVFLFPNMLLLLLPFFRDCYFSINENDDASENDTKYWTKHWNKQNTIEAPENISVLNKIFDILKWK